MSIAVNCDLGQGNIATARALAVPRIARIEVFSDLVRAEPFWRALERDDAWSTPYQRFDLLATWHRHVGMPKGIVPHVVVGLDAVGRPLFLWPLGRKRLGPFMVAGFLGSKHASFNIALWRRDVVGTIGADDVGGVLARLRHEGGDVDLLALYSQPLSWDGSANPLALLPRQLSAEDGSCLHLDATGAQGALSRAMQSKLKIKERKLKRLSGYRYLQARDAGDVDRLLGAFFELKAVHMRARGLPNVFTETGVAEFLREASHLKLANGRPLIELHALEGGGEVLAVYGAIVDRYRFSAMFNTYTLSAQARHSPGLILLRHMVGACAERGTVSFDIGVGRADYKSFFCKEPEPLFDTFFALTPRGRLVLPAFRTAFAAKRTIKSKPALWAAVQSWRRLRAR